MKSPLRAEGQFGAVSGAAAPRGSGAVAYIEDCPSAAPAAPGLGQSPEREIKGMIESNQKPIANLDAAAMASFQAKLSGAVRPDASFHPETI